MRLLVCEDEKDLNKIISMKLSSDGYAVDSSYDGEEALDYLEFTEYDGIILDIMMPKIDGIEVLRRMRSSGNLTPVLFLTAKDTVSDKVKGLDEGANDYIVKPFSFEELTARIRAMLRKNYSTSSNVITVSDLSVDIAAHRVKRGDDEISLSSKEFALLEYLIINKGVVLSREKIENHIWNYDYEGGTNVVDVYIRYLRKKIDDERENKLIHTIRGSGYVLRESK